MIRTDIRPVDEDEVDALQTLLEACTDHAQQVTGYPTGPSDALSTLLQLPEGLDPERKTVLALRDGAAFLGVADLLLGYPEASTTTLGLLLVVPEARRQGLGTRLHAHVALRARDAGSARIRIGLVDTNAPDSEPFFRRIGYAPEGDALPFRYDRLQSTVRHWTLRL